MKKTSSQGFLIKKDRMTSASESALWCSNSTSMADGSTRRESAELLEDLCLYISLSLFVSGLVHLIKIISQALCLETQTGIYSASSTC